MTSKIKWNKLLPVFMSFIVMGFVDIVGVSTGYIQKDFDLPDNLAQLIPSMAFIWFFFLSVPVGIFQDKWGKKNMLVLGMALSGVGMLIPFIGYSFPIMLAAFVFLGIGNTIVQVSANPLLQDVSPREKFSSFMSLTQFVKAIVSLLGPIIAAFVATQFGNWKLVFAVYAVTSLIAVLWLYFTKIEESGVEKEPATFKSCFSLLKNPFILMMVVGIFLTVGADVGMNSNIQNYMMNGFGWDIEKASLGISVYFIALMISRFLGAVLLNFVKPRLFLIITTAIALLSVILLFVAPNPTIGLIAIFLVGFGSGNLFPLIFSITIDKMPDRSNEISGLMIMAVSGGAFIPPIMGAISESFGFLISLLVLVICMVYLFLISFVNSKK
ncbi:Fucose permease [Lutibacter agarilyticus]|uniref:Fucose permease n=2 Tax=Lutibacter agarilyticus TaxID=1109740 RepID=A0A238WAL9_9FLAO|nr:Fucose permease [Lutibacter agarilyticus]